MAHMMRVPTWLAAAPMGAAISMERPTPAKIVTSGGDKNVDLGLLAHGLAQLCRHNGDDEDGQRAAGSAQRVGGVAYRDQAEQHQRRAVECPADGDGHGRAAHGRGIAAQVHQHVQPGLLAQCFDDGADEQAGKQALRHGTQRLNEVALRGNDDVFSS